MTPLVTILAGVGGVLLLVGLVGGGFTISAKFLPHVGMPKVGNWVRLPCFGIGGVLILAAIGLAVITFPPPNPPGDPGASSSPTAAAVAATTSAPAPTPSASPSPTDTGEDLATGTISPDEGYSSVYVFSQPSLSSSAVAQVTAGTTVGILCTAQGDVVTRSDNGEQSSLWDRTSDGFIPDVYVYTGTDQATMGQCEQ